MQLWFVVLGFLLAATSGPPAAEEIQITGSAGWGGRVHPGQFAPVLVDLDNKGSKDVALSLQVTWAASYRGAASESITLGTVTGRSGPVYTVKVPLPSKTRKRVSLSVLAPDPGPLSVWAFARDDTSGRSIAGTEFLVRMVDPSVRIVGVVGRSRPVGLESPSLQVANVQPEELPEEWQGYAALEALLWMDGRALELRSAAPVDALRQWVSAGGTFVAAIGVAHSLAGTPIADLLPVELGSTRELASLGGGRLPEIRSAVLASTVRGGVVRAQAEGVPLVVESGRDAGRVGFVAFDPSNERLAGWPGAPTFWRWLLDWGPDARPPGDSEQAPAVIGSVSLSRHASQIPDVAPPQIGGLFLLLLLYLVVVGPLDYLVLRSIRRLEYTWFTFPAYVAVFTLVILLVGGAFIQRPGYQREIAVVDHFPQTGFVRTRALSAVLSPSDRVYQAQDAEPLSSNFYERAGLSFSSENTTDVSIVQAPRRMAVNWVLNRNYTGLALADRCGTSPSPLSYRITAQTPREVRLTIRNGLGGVLRNSLLVTPKGTYSVAEISPGESAVVGILRAEPLSRPPAEPSPEELQYRTRVRRYRADNALLESELNPEVERLLLSLSFPGRTDADPSVRGMARGLDAGRFTRSGGSVLLAWPQKAPALVRFDPQPGRFSFVTLYRFFQGPPP